MTNIASLLKTEISRVARKEVRAETASLKKTVSTYRAEIAALKRRAQALQLELRRLSKAHAEAVPVEMQAKPAQKLRFTAKGLASQRRRLGLSALDIGLLVGASGQSIYNWEEGKAHPRAKHLPAIAALRTMGKKEASARLAALR
jgi:DNA-binding transcriptional regulator YiaG